MNGIYAYKNLPFLGTVYLMVYILLEHIEYSSLLM
jgi:hypothetical protein